MKRLPILIIIAAIAAAIVSCKTGDDPSDYWDKYREWRENNNAWLALEIERIDDKTGGKYYTTVTPSWDEEAHVYVHWFNNPADTRDNDMPLLTSTVDVKYYGKDYLNQAFDSSYVNTTPADSIYRTKLQNVIDGWQIALTKMHVGDSVVVIVPYKYGYGSTIQKNSTGSVTLKPYTNLIFNIKLVGIPGLYKEP